MPVRACASYSQKIQTDDSPLVNATVTAWLRELAAQCPLIMCNLDAKFATRMAQQAAFRLAGGKMHALSPAVFADPNLEFELAGSFILRIMGPDSRPIRRPAFGDYACAAIYRKHTSISSTHQHALGAFAIHSFEHTGPGKFQLFTHDLGVAIQSASIPVPLFQHNLTECPVMPGRPGQSAPRTGPC